MRVALADGTEREVPGEFRKLSSLLTDIERPPTGVQAMSDDTVIPLWGVPNTAAFDRITAIMHAVISADPKQPLFGLSIRVPLDATCLRDDHHPTRRVSELLTSAGLPHWIVKSMQEHIPIPACAEVLETATYLRMSWQVPFMPWFFVPI